ncbi:MAG: glycoside hydrolase family 27 protein [Oscillospiraceae bacterium]
MKENLFTNAPPMGWNSWNTFMFDLNEETLREIALSLKSQGFLEAGYTYFCLDDGWEDKTRRIGHGVDYDKKKFPSGLAAFGDFLHDLGFKFGIYSCAGTLTCGGYPASYGYEYEDAENFAKWGVDLLKYDNCYVPADVQSKYLYRRMGQALRETGRPILYSMCNWGFDDSQNWARTTGANIYRIGGDIRDTWENIEGGMNTIAGLNISAHSGVGCFADPDFLVVGMNGDGAVSHLGEETSANATDSIYRVQFSLWCMLCAPLFMSHDPRKTTQGAKDILLNHEMIAVNQDPAFIPAYQCKVEKMLSAWEMSKTEIWAKPLYNGDVVVGLFNRREGPTDLVASFESFGFAITDTVCAYDLWAHEEIGLYRGSITINVGGRDCKVLRLHRQK